jgi:hypothetical protein
MLSNITMVAVGKCIGRGQFRRRNGGDAVGLLPLSGPPHRVLFGKHAIGELQRGRAYAGEHPIDDSIFAVVHPWTARKFAVVQPELVPVRCCLDQLTREIRTVFQTTFNDDVYVRFQQWMMT